MNSYTSISAPQVPENPGIANFLTLRAGEIREVVEDLGLDSVPVVAPNQFAAHLVLVLGQARNKRGAVTWPTFFGQVAPVVDEYWTGPLTAVEVVSLVKRLFTGNQGRRFRELAQRYQASAEDHLLGRFVDPSPERST